MQFSRVTICMMWLVRLHAVWIQTQPQLTQLLPNNSPSTTWAAVIELHNWTMNNLWNHTPASQLFPAHIMNILLYSTREHMQKKFATSVNRKRSRDASSSMQLTSFFRLKEPFLFCVGWRHTHDLHLQTNIFQTLQLWPRIMVREFLLKTFSIPLRKHILVDFSLDLFWKTDIIHRSIVLVPCLVM